MTSETAVDAQSPAAEAEPPSQGDRKGGPGRNPDAPVRIDVAMPRALFDRLTDHDRAPRCRYDMATGMAEYVAEPGVGHEGRAAEITRLFNWIEYALDEAGQPRRFYVMRASRLLSDEGAFEPDESLYTDPAKARAALRVENYLDTRKGHPVPDLVVEIDRSVESSHKLGPYFRMGVREAWTWGPRDGARIWTSDPGHPKGFGASVQSRVLSGMDRDDLEGLLADPSDPEEAPRARRLARRVAQAILSGRDRG